MTWLSRILAAFRNPDPLPEPYPPAPEPLPIAQPYQCGACETAYETASGAMACCGHSERGGSREDALRAEIPRAAMLTARDRERLRGVHPDLIRVVERARRDVEFYVSEGVRSVERQRELVARGASRTMNSRHLTGHAVDLYPVSDVPVPAMTARDLAPVVSAMKRAALVEGVPMVHGADWGWDHPHHELSRARYPA